MFYVLIGQLHIIFCQLLGPALGVVWWGGEWEVLFVSYWLVRPSSITE